VQYYARHVPNLGKTHQFHRRQGKSLSIWLQVSTDFLYRDIEVLFVALDANFCLRCRAVSNDQSDPSLSQGWAYFVEDTAFKKYLCDHKNDTQEACLLTPEYWHILILIEKSTCSNHNAVNMAGCQVQVYSGRGSGQVWMKTDEGQGQGAGQEVSLARVGDRLDSTTKDNKC